MKHLLSSFILLCATSCILTIPERPQVKNDTAKIIDLAIRTAFYRQSMPSIDPLMYPYRFKDSVLFTSDNFPLNYLPQTVDSLNFKVLPKNEIISLIKSDMDYQKLPNYLYLRSLEKRDTGYYVSLQSLSCFPFGGGGAIGISIVKVKDSFLVTNKQSSSIN